MTVYIILFLGITIFWLFESGRYRKSFVEKACLFLSTMSMAVVVGLRSNMVGEDTQHYVDIFRCSSYVSWYDIFHSVGFRTGYYTDQYGYTDTIENGYLILCKIIHCFTDNPQVYLLTVSVMTFLLIAKFIKDNSTDILLSVEVVLCEYFFMMSFNEMRQCLAIAVAVQAYALLRSKKIKSAIIVILVAALLHNSALITLVLLPIVLINPDNKQKSFRIISIFVAMAPIILILCQNILVQYFPRYTSYYTVNYWQNTLGGKLILIIIEINFIIIFYKRNFDVHDSYYLSLICIIGIAFQLAGLQIAAFDRLGWYFRIYLVLFFPVSMKIYDLKTRHYLSCVLIFLLAVLYLHYASADARDYSFFLIQY